MYQGRGVAIHMYLLVLGVVFWQIQKFLEDYGDFLHYFENIHSSVFLSVICHTRFFFGIHKYFLFIGFSEKSSTEIRSDLIALVFLMGIRKKASRTIFDS